MKKYFLIFLLPFLALLSSATFAQDQGGSGGRDDVAIDAANISLRDAIPYGKRKWGMLVDVYADPTPANNKIYCLKYNNSSTNKLDNSNWVDAATVFGGGGSGITGLTSPFLPKATSSTTIGNSALRETAGYLSGLNGVSGNNIYFGAFSHSAPRRIEIEENSNPASGILYPLRLSSVNGGALSVGFGSGLEFATRSLSGSNVVGNTIESLSTNLGAGTESFDLVFKGMTAGALAEKFRIKGTGDITVTGKISNLTDPSSAQDAATKNYVDNFATGLSIKSSSNEATTAALPSNTYSNGASGVGATLTATATGVLTVDGVTVALNDRVLVKNEATQSRNGIYVCTTAGAGGVAYVLTRATDFDQSTEIAGGFTFVIAGTANANIGYVVNSTGPYTIGTTAITFTQFSGGGGGTTTNALSIGAELISAGPGSFNGSAAKSIAIQPSSVTNSMLAGSIDLTSKVTGLLPHANIAATTVTPGSCTNCNLTIQADGSVTASSNGSTSALIPTNTQSGNYTLVIGDVGYEIDMSSASATNLTVPPNSSVAFSIGQVIWVKRTNSTGLVTFVQGAGVTITGSSGGLIDAGYNVVQFLRKTGTDTWDLQNGSPSASVDYLSTASYTGWTANPTGGYKYTVFGKTVFLQINLTGTSNSTATTITLPFIPANSGRWIFAGDNNGSGITGRANMSAGSTTVSLFSSVGAGAWTASGTKTISINYFYEMQ